LECQSLLAFQYLPLPSIRSKFSRLESQDNQSKGYSQQHFDNALREIILDSVNSKPKTDGATAASEAELTKIDVKDADVEAVMAALEVHKDSAVDALRRGQGDLKKALSSLVAPPPAALSASG
jgi:NACalpha-BTF3-like transcription factor